MASRSTHAADTQRADATVSLALDVSAFPTSAIPGQTPGALSQTWPTLTHPSHRTTHDFFGERLLGASGVSEAAHGPENARGDRRYRAQLILARSGARAGYHRPA